MRVMKDSGIEWIGEIPEEWHVSKMKYVGEYINGYAFKPSQWGAEGKQIIRIQDLTKTFDQPNYFSGELDAKYLVTAGDLLVSWAATLDAFVWDKEDAWLNQHIFKAIPKENAVCKSYFYWLIKEAMLNMNNDNKHGIMMQHVTYDVFDNFAIPLPPLCEQRRIAEYLKGKCEEIDVLIAAKEKTNTLLRERRQGIIYEAVTKGLDPNAPMKDSGIEWIGEIPTHWDTIRAKFFAEITNGSDPKTEGDIRVYGSGSESFKTCGEFKEGPVVLLGRKGATLHIPHYVEGKYWNVDTAFDVRTNENVCSLKFYYYVAICFDYKLYISTTTLPSMTQYNYGNMFIPIPAVEEQAEIVEHIELKLSELDRVISDTEKNIQKLKEYRQSVIYEAVTGKIEI